MHTLSRTRGSKGTAAHAHFEVVCDEARIPYDENAGITALFQLIRQPHKLNESTALVDERDLRSVDGEN
jgi:hypothetical protein